MNHATLSRREFLTALILLTTVIGLVFANIWSNSFVWDDEYFILADLGTHRLSNIPAMFSRSFEHVYRPVKMSLITCLYALGGHDTRYYHLNALFWHLVSCLTLYCLSRRWIQTRAALGCTLLFAVHPIHTEAVTFMTAGLDLPAGAFFLLSFHLFWQRANRERAWLSLFFFLLAAFSSEMALSLPLLLSAALAGEMLGVDRKQHLGAAIRAVGPYFLIAGLYLAIRFFVIGLGSRAEGYPGGSLWTTLLTMIGVLSRYLFLLLWPLQLSTQYDIPLVTTIQGEFLWDFAAIIGLLGLAVFAAWRGKKVAALAIFGIFITFLPVSNIIPTGTLMAERYAYLPSVGFCLLIGLGLDALAAKPGRRFGRPSQGLREFGPGLALLLAGILLASQTHERNQVWHDSMKLWQVTVRQTPSSFVAYNNLGNAYKKQDKFPWAIGCYRRATEINPTYHIAWNNLGDAYRIQGRLRLAEQALARATRIDPELSQAWYNLGLLFWSQNRLAEAKEAIDTVARLNPDQASAVLLRAAILDRQGQIPAAVRSYQRYLELVPAPSDPNGLNARRRLKTLQKNLDANF